LNPIKRRNPSEVAHSMDRPRILALTNTASKHSEISPAVSHYETQSCLLCLENHSYKSSGLLAVWFIYLKGPEGDFRPDHDYSIEYEVDLYCVHIADFPWGNNEANCNEVAVVVRRLLTIVQKNRPRTHSA
jgi:hypothetical protein